MTDREEEVKGFPSIWNKLTAEQQQAAEAKGRELVTKDRDVNLACAVMIEARRLYALARLALQRSLETEGHKWEDGVEEFLIVQMASKGDAGGWTIQGLLEAMQRSVLPFVATEANRANQAEAAEDKQLAAEREAERRASALVLTVGQGEIVLHKGEVAVLAGEEGKVREAMAEILGTVKSRQAMGQELNCLRIAEWGETAKKKARLVQRPRELWDAMAVTRSGLRKTLDRTRPLFTGNHIDLIAVSNGLVGRGRDAVGLSAMANVLWWLAGWCKENGTSAVVGLPTDLDDEGRELVSGKFKDNKIIWLEGDYEPGHL